MQWLQDQEKAARQGGKSHTRSATATSASCSSTSLAGFKSASSGGRSPRGGGTSGGGGHSPSQTADFASSTSLASALASSLTSRVSSSSASSPRHSPPHRGLQSPVPSTSSTRTPPGGRSPNSNTAGSSGRSSTSQIGDRIGRSQQSHSAGGGGRSPNYAASIGNRSPKNTGKEELAVVDATPTSAAASDAGGNVGGNAIPRDNSSTFLGFNDWVSEESEGDIMARVSGASAGVGQL